MEIEMYSPRTSSSLVVSLLDRNSTSISVILPKPSRTSARSICISPSPSGPAMVMLRPSNLIPVPMCRVSCAGRPAHPPSGSDVRVKVDDLLVLAQPADDQRIDLPQTAEVGALGQEHVQPDMGLEVHHADGGRELSLPREHRGHVLLAAGQPEALVE